MLRSTLLALLVTGGCVPSHSELRSPVDTEIVKRLDMQVAIASPEAVAELLGRPLDRATAVRLALAYSPRLRVAFAELGIAGSELATAVGLGPLAISGTVHFAGENEIEIMQGIEGLLLAPRRRAAARAGLVAAQAMATATALRLVARAEIAFNDLIAAQQELELRHTAFDAADAAAMIRERMHAAGNTPELALARDRDAREQARVDLGRAEARTEIARERLNALLGLSGAQTKWTASGMLADLPASAPALDDLEPTAVAASLDLAAGRAQRDSATNTVGAETARTWLPELGVGWGIQEHDGAWRSGPAVSLGIPLFDQRRGARARARAELSRVEAVLTAEAIELRAGARAARIGALGAYQEARHLRMVVLPLRQQIVDQLVLHYNAMDADPFELIFARRQLADAGQQYLDALRRFWNAMSEVTALRHGVRVETMSVPLATPASRETRDDRHP
jgi:cobalt-zinc-cadmium efflux system outer membrane protein